MTYTPDPTNVNEPDDTVIAETMAAEFRALKSYIKGWITTATSTTSLTPALGNQSFTLAAASTFYVGEFVSAVSAGTPTSYMYGQVYSVSGTALVVTVQAVGNAAAGAKADWNIGPSGIIGPTGVQGPAGPTGPVGATGAGATVALGTVTTLAAGSSATITNSGSSAAATFNFGLPGSPTLAVGTVTAGAAGSTPAVVNAGTAYAASLNFTLPGSCTVAVGTVTQLAAGATPTVSNSGTTYAATLAFGLPASCTVSIGTVTTLAAGSSATVTNAGTVYAAVLNFGIPQGAAGSGTGNFNGPVSSTDGDFVQFNGTGGQTGKDGNYKPASFCQVANNLSDVTASAARSNLGLAIGTNVQAYSTLLADIAGASLSQGDILYYNGTHLANLSAGTSGYFLKTQGTGANPVWAAASGGASRTLITSSAASGASVNFTSGISSTYDIYEIEFIDLVPAAGGGVDMYLRVSEDGGSTWKSAATTYFYDVAMFRGGSQNNSQYYTTNTGDTQLRLNLNTGIVGRLDATSGYHTHGKMLMFAPSSASNIKTFQWDLLVPVSNIGPDLSRHVGMGVYSGDQNAINAVQFYLSSGNFSSGTIRLWGWSKS